MSTALNSVTNIYPTIFSLIQDLNPHPEVNDHREQTQMQKVHILLRHDLSNTRKEAAFIKEAYAMQQPKKKLHTQLLCQMTRNKSIIQSSNDELQAQYCLI